MTNCGDRLTPAKEAALKIEAAYQLLQEVAALLRIPTANELPRLRVRFPDSKDYYQEGDIKDARQNS